MYSVLTFGGGDLLAKTNETISADNDVSMANVREDLSLLRHSSERIDGEIVGEEDEISTEGVSEVGNINVSISDSNSVGGDNGGSDSDTGGNSSDNLRLVGDSRNVDKVEDKGEVSSEEVTTAVSSIIEVEATAYTAECDGCSGITYSGVDVRNTIYYEGRRIIAVDPSVISLGTVVEITYATGHSFEAVAEDIGSAIKGRRIDILVDTKEEAFTFGRQDVEVRIITEGER